MSVKIKTRPRGPLMVEGEVELFDGQGEPIDTTGRTKLALCRCGASTNRPMCDGSHNRIGFEGDQGGS